MLILLISLPIFIALADKYAANGALRKTLGEKLSDATVSISAELNRVNVKPIDRCETPIGSARYRLALVNGVWQLMRSSPGDRAIQSSPARTPYSVDVSGPTLKLTQTEPGDSCRFEVRLEGVDTYHSVGVTAATDLPTDPESREFRVYEQEDYVPIFGYHFVMPDDKAGGNSLEVPLSAFVAQVEYATNVMGCRWITFGELMKGYVLPQKKAPRRACVMTFDDGRRDNFEVAAPVLREYGIRASFYIITGRPGKAGAFMNWNQIDALYREGHEIGSHTVTHIGAIMSGNDFDRIIYEVWQSRQTLEARGYPIDTFAYPQGAWSPTTVEALKATGYLGARAIGKQTNLRDRRALTISMDPDFIWHMNYSRPEVNSTSMKPLVGEQIAAALGYNTWWQFEEGHRVNYGEVGIHKLNITPASFASVLLHPGSSITNKFIVSRAGAYTLEMFIATGFGRDFGAEIDTQAFRVYMDGVELKEKTPTDDCLRYGIAIYCSVYVSAQLDAGVHTLTVESGDEVSLDRYRLFQTHTLETMYEVVITEYGRSAAH